MRRWLTRSRTLHAAAKWLSSAQEVPFADWIDLARTRDILRVLPNTMLPASRLIQAYEAVRTVDRDGITGDIAECGVWSGGTIGLMALACETPRTFHAFDSFVGCPQPSSRDGADVITAFRYHHPDTPLSDSGPLVAADACVGASTDAVRAFVLGLGLDPCRLRITPGWFQDTLPTADVGPLAILRVDGDYYDSTKVCLDSLLDRVVSGGFLILDDYGHFPGCEQATNDALCARGLSPDRLVTVDYSCRYLRMP